MQNTQRQVVLNRELMDAVPTARNYSGLASLMPGVRMSNTDVGGNQQMEQIYMTVNGSRQTDTTVQVDGMNLNSLMNDGQVQAYFSDAAMAEITYQTSGVTADVSTGGVRINMVPKDGGNIFSGQAFFGGTDGDWQANNVTDELRARGLTSGSRVAKIQDINFGVGGPIKKDKLWFFASWRRIATDSVIPGSYFANGEVGTGVEDQWIQNQMVRLTWQVNSKNKFSIYHDRYPKFKGHEVIVGCGRRVGYRGRPPRPGTRPVLHRAGEVDVDDQQPAAPRSWLFDQRRVPLHRLSARRSEGTQLARVVQPDRQERLDHAAGV